MLLFAVLTDLILLPAISLTNRGSQFLASRLEGRQQLAPEVDLR